MDHKKYSWINSNSKPATFKDWCFLNQANQRRINNTLARTSLDNHKYDSSFSSSSSNDSIRETEEKPIHKPLLFMDMERLRIDNEVQAFIVSFDSLKEFYLRKVYHRPRPSIQLEKPLLFLNLSEAAWCRSHFSSITIICYNNNYNNLFFLNARTFSTSSLSCSLSHPLLIRTNALSIFLVGNISISDPIPVRHVNWSSIQKLNTNNLSHESSEEFSSTYTGRKGSSNF